MTKWILDLPWALVIAGCLTLGLAPFAPPHLVEKVGMLARGELRKPIDWFDLFFHLVPWALAAAKVALTLQVRVR